MFIGIRDRKIEIIEPSWPPQDEKDMILVDRQGNKRDGKIRK